MSRSRRKPPGGRGGRGGKSDHASGSGPRRRGLRADRGQAKQAPKGLRHALPRGLDQLEGRNVVLAALQASKRVKELWFDERAQPDEKLELITDMARRQRVTFRKAPREDLDAISQAAVHNGLIGFAEPLPSLSLKDVLDAVSDAGRDPFILLLDQVQYDQNLGAILRSSAAAGVDAIVIPTRRGASMNATVQRIAMGGAEVVPLVRESMTSATATLARRGIRLIAAEADGECKHWDADLTGPIALALGGEDRGVGPKIRERCDQVVSVPIDPGPVTSLNVSVTAGLLLFERVRQTQS